MPDDSHPVPFRAGQEPTEKVPVLDTATLPLVVSPSGATAGEDLALGIHPEDPDDTWVSQAPSGMLRLHYLTAVLAVLVVLAGGFWGGVIAEKHHNGGSSTATLSALRARIAARGGSGAGGGAFPGPAASSSSGAFAGARSTSLTRGTVVGIKGAVLQVEDSSGNLVKVTLAPGAIVSLSEPAQLNQLKVGDLVIISGTAKAGGTISAAVVRASAPGQAGSSRFAGTG